MKTLYSFDSSGVYLGETAAPRNPLEPGEFLLLFGTTETPPPTTVPDDKLACWDGAKWGLKDVEVPEFVPPPTPVPATDVHVAYFRAALASLGKLEDVDALVNADPVKAQLWGWATSISITDPDVVAVASALSIDLEAVLALAVSLKNSRTVETNDA